MRKGAQKENKTLGGVVNLKRALLGVLAAALLATTASVALAADITPKTYSRTYNDGSVQTVTHPYGFWNNPATAGRETYNYNNPQDYTEVPGPHGNYTTATHKCRECHAVHRAAGKFKLLRADSRVEACDWCHGLGAGSGANIQMDNDDAYTQEYNVGHTMGFGTSDGKFKAPDDTYPAYTPKYYMGGFSCIDCHSPHGNPQRILGGYPKPGTADWANLAAARGITQVRVAKVGNMIPVTSVTALVIANPGHYPQYSGDPWGPTFPGGKWILVENPDVERDANGQEIKDWDISAYNGYPVNKMAYDWDFPFGPNNDSTTTRVVKPSGTNYIAIVTVNEFCADCHDGNAGRSTLQTKLFSEERALRGDADPYDIGYGHDTNPRH